MRSRARVALSLGTSGPVSYGTERPQGTVSPLVNFVSLLGKSNSTYLLVLFFLLLTKHFLGKQAFSSILGSEASGRLCVCHD